MFIVEIFGYSLQIYVLINTHTPHTHFYKIEKILEKLL